MALNIPDLSAKEKAATAGEWHWESSRLSRCSLEDRAFIVAARNSMRPLLTLVEKLGTALEILYDSHNPRGACQPCDYCRKANAALNAYREAGGTG